jgi:hypothetical protein
VVEMSATQVIMPDIDRDPVELMDSGPIQVL